MSEPSILLHGVLPAAPWWLGAAGVVIIAVIGYLMLGVAPARF